MGRLRYAGNFQHHPAPIAQVIFFQADEVCEVSYADKKGKYQHQQSIILPKI